MIHNIIGHHISSHRIGLMILCCIIFSPPARAQPTVFFETHCYSCHHGKLKKGGLDLSALKLEPDNFAPWVKIHDRIEAGEMPPGKKKPPAAEVAAALKLMGAQIRRVPLPAGCPRGPFLTQGAILKITANGTTTSPVPRGAFVMDHLLGQPPEPPPPNIPAIEPDVRGAKTIRAQLDKHRSNAACASCHAKMDPPGFALESFDVIGGLRTRYRSIGAGDPAPRGAIDPFIGIGFKLGPAVDASGVLPDGRTFSGINEFQDLLAADRGKLMTNLARQFAVYGTGRNVSFGDRADIAAIVANTQKRGGGIRTLIHELTESRLFQTH